jgi:hypothetical protein
MNECNTKKKMHSKLAAVNSKPLFSWTELHACCIVTEKQTNKQTNWENML